ncbi:antitoxin [Herbiconiux sp. P15]|uniref:type II toxin-antitoxin system VapB family antitoxin n=1 Tax=Herbiconiux liukaitaii TaxID=3342799 RepID=UPI0035B92745
MTDILIRDVPESVVAEIDLQAGRLGLSRVEFIRRQLVREASRSHQTVEAADILASTARLAGLLDEQLMEDAWR